MIYSELVENLGSARTPSEVSGLHGRISGWLSAGAAVNDIVESGLLDDWAGTKGLNGELIELVSVLGTEVRDELRDIDLGFQLLLPEDGVDINLRQQCISHWCNGFLSGFGVSGRFQQSELSEEVAEVLTDLTRIASLDEEIPGDDENEADLIEIVEYVRMGTLLVFTECTNKLIH